MKKFTAALAVLLLLCMVFSACTAKSVSSPDDEYNKTSVTADDLNSTLSASSTEENSASEITQKSDTEKKSTTAKEVRTTTEKIDSKAKTTAPVTSKKQQSKTTHKRAQSKIYKTASAQAPKSKSTADAAQKAAEVSSTSASNTSTAKTTALASASKRTTTSTTVTTATTSSSAEITCTVKIECGKILDNMDSLKAGHADFVPDDGVILNTYTITMPSGSTAYDALEKACDDNDIKLSAQKTTYGIYVQGINNIDEKDCGKSSGWLYCVNDTFPSRSCGYYKLSNGDTVVFSYTC